MMFILKFYSKDYIMGTIRSYLAKISRWSLRKAWWSIDKVFRISLLALFGLFLAGLIGFAFYMKSLPSLFTWHTTILQNEFTIHSDVKDFDGYIALEKQLFQELVE